MKKFRLALLSLVLCLILAPWGYAGQVDLKILYVNDFHGFAEPYKPTGAEAPLGGIAYLAGAVDRARGKQPCLLLAAGDMIQGHPWANLFQGKSSLEVMNAMRFDAMVVGNHEFDFGPKVLKERMAQARFPVLAANVKGVPALKPYVIKNLQGVRVAIIGVVTPETPVATHPRNVAGLTFSTPESAVKKYLPELKGRADIIIVLSHCGFQADRELAARVPEIDVIVGGHSHTKILQPEVVGRTIIVQAWEHAKVLGVLTLRIKDGKIAGFDGALQEISPATGAPNSQVQEIVARYARQVDSLLQRVIGETQVDLDGEHVRTGETNLGDFIADVMRQTAGAEAALINGGTIRTGIPQGKITVKDIYAVLPFDNYLVAISLTGAQIQSALEHGVARLEEPAGSFPQVSGLTFTYSRSAPAGARVKDVTVGGRPLDPQKEYVVATNDYLVAGGDGYTVFGEALKSAGDYANLGGALTSSKLAYNDPGTWLRDLVITAIQARKTIAPQTDGRIKAVD
jgi:2',3'-cyclic-nucleotide 2'-phosphodiesterase (5'-nucleotidase family)